MSVPRAAPGWAPAARRWYTSLSQSAQAKFFEPSDWEYARLLAELLSKQLKARRQSAEMLKAVLSAMDNLGTTEGARRRMRIEIQRAAPADKGEAAKVAVLDRYRKAIDSG